VTARPSIPILFACLLLGLGMPACAHDFRVEGRETRVNIWLTMPHLAQAGGQVEALVYVGPYKVVHGPVVFEKGSPTVNLPPLFIREGSYDVAAVIDGGRFSIRENIDIEGESWVQIIVRDQKVSLEYTERQPDPWGR
jgi:hypothetical protein